MATPLGVAKKTQSQPASGALAGSLKARSKRPRSDGK
jgi:hypothetical protein